MNEWHAVARATLLIVSLSLCITQGLAQSVTGRTNEVTSKAPEPATVIAPLDPSRPAAGEGLVDSPGAERFGSVADQYPYAVPTPDAASRKVVIESDRQSRSKTGEITLDGNVVLQYAAYRVEADHIAYDPGTGAVVAAGHLRLVDAAAQVDIAADHAAMNVIDGTGRFFAVHGSVGVRMTPRGNVYTNSNPFLFTGREVIKSGPRDLEILDGTVTSCQLPHPDWQLAAARFTVHDGKARAYNTTFRLRDVPVLLLPYATHPVGENERQSGFMIPVIGQSSLKGLVIGEQIYFAMGRSAELTVGAEYFSRRGFQQSATFRYRGNGHDFVLAHYSGLLDRGFNTATTNAAGMATNTYTNQGGEDVSLSGRKDFSDYTRVAADVEYLSSYVYRQAFTENFNQAVSTDILSYAYGTHARDGYMGSVVADRYQGVKRTATGEQIRIFRTPMLNVESSERRVGFTPLLWSATAQYAGLKRTQGTQTAVTNFATDITSRVDFHPRLSLPFSVGGLRVRPVVGLRETYYNNSRQPTPLPGPPPVEVARSLHRVMTEAELELRLPVLTRTFDTGVFYKLLGREARHTIEPEVTYRFARGAQDFARTLRFDDTDVVNDKNEVEYGVTQRLFLRPVRERACGVNEDSAKVEGGCGGTRESLRWRLVQRRYFDENFNGIIVANRRNVLDNTLDLTGVAFLTDPRTVSPIVSEIKLSATDHLDVEWDMNYDTHAGKFTQSNTFIDVHVGKVFGGLSHARLNAPGRFQTGTTTSLTSDFSQLRTLLGYGMPSKVGLSLAANVGIDLKRAEVQYGATQVSYNWNCCGVSGEYRRYALGSVRNENSYRFNFTLVNIGTAGNLRRSERLF